MFVMGEMFDNKIDLPDFNIGGLNCSDQIPLVQTPNTAGAAEEPVSRKLSTCLYLVVIRGCQSSVGVELTCSVKDGSSKIWIAGSTRPTRTKRRSPSSPESIVVLGSHRSPSSGHNSLVDVWRGLGVVLWMMSFRPPSAPFFGLLRARAKITRGVEIR